jgi:hypothetical protein
MLRWQSSLLTQNETMWLYKIYFVKTFYDNIKLTVMTTIINKQIFDASYVTKCNLIGIIMKLFWMIIFIKLIFDNAIIDLYFSKR